MFCPTIAVQVNDLGAFRLHRGDTATTRIGPVLVVVALIVLKLVPQVGGSCRYVVLDNLKELPDAYGVLNEKLRQ